MGKHILIVDDIAKNIQVLGSILLKDQYDISYATNGRQALDMVASEAYDLILLDIMMPGMDGLEVCRQLRALPDKANVPVIFLTARSEKQDIVAGFETGAVDYITKPFNSAELKARVRTHLALKNARDQIADQNKQLKGQNEELEKVNRKLNDALKKIQTLEGIIPICCICKNIRNDDGYWEQVEGYIAEHSQATFSHGICPGCMETHYADLDEDLNPDEDGNDS